MACLATASGACRSGPVLESASAPAAPSAGIHELTIPGPGGADLRFTVSVPAGYDGVHPVPLVLALHYGGRSPFPPYYGRNVLELLVQPALEPLGAVIVAPDAADSGWSDEVDDKRVLALLDHVLATYAIDRKRILCTGYSMGGAGTWHFIIHHPDRFTAAIPIAGRPPTDTTAPPRVPVYAIHSRADEVVPLPATEAYVTALRTSGADVQLTIVEGLTHFQTDRFVPALRAALPWLTRIWTAPPHAAARTEATP